MQAWLRETFTVCTRIPYIYNIGVRTLNFQCPWRESSFGVCFPGCVHNRCESNAVWNVMLQHPGVCSVCLRHAWHCPCFHGEVQRTEVSRFHLDTSSWWTSAQAQVRVNICVQFRTVRNGRSSDSDHLKELHTGASHGAQEIQMPEQQKALGSHLPSSPWPKLSITYSYIQNNDTRVFSLNLYPCGLSGVILGWLEASSPASLVYSWENGRPREAERVLCKFTDLSRLFPPLHPASLSLTPTSLHPNKMWNIRGDPWIL